MKKSPIARLRNALCTGRTNLFALAVLLSVSLPALAQRATVGGDTVYRAGTAYALVHTSGTSNHPNFSFRTLGGEEFMMMTYDDAAGDYRIVFFPGEEQTRLPARYGSLDVVAQEVVDNRFVESGDFNRAGLKRFMLAHPPAASPGATPAKSTTTGTSERGTTSETIRKIDSELEAAVDDVSEAVLNIGAAVERAFDKDSVRRAERRTKESSGARLHDGLPLTASGAQLSKNGTVVATYEVKAQGTTAKGSRIYTIRAPGGTAVAKATVPNQSPKSAKIVTSKDDRTSTLPLYGSTKEEDAADIGTWLVAQGYL